MAAVACGCSEQLVYMHDLTVGRVLLGNYSCLSLIYGG